MNSRARWLRFVADAGPLESRIAAGLAKIALAARHELFRTAAPRGLSPVQAQILAILARGGPRLVGELATRLGLAAPTVSDSIAALERHGWVRRRRDPDDARRVRVEATRKGSAAGRALALWPEFLAEGVAHLQQDEKVVLLRAIAGLIRDLIARGTVQEAGVCPTCRFFRPNVHPDPERPHHCLFADVAFGDAALRVDCPDHVPAAEAVAGRRRSAGRLAGATRPIGKAERRVRSI
jgi:DNA-binding MarR family transcriptional regulator